MSSSLVCMFEGWRKKLVKICITYKTILDHFQLIDEDWELAMDLCSHILFYILCRSHLCTEQLIYTPVLSKLQESAEISIQKYKWHSIFQFFFLIFIPWRIHRPSGEPPSWSLGLFSTPRNSGRPLPRLLSLVQH